MSGKSKKLSISLSEPFAAVIWTRAQDLAHAYRLTLEQNSELGYVGSSIEMSNVFVDARTPNECVKLLKEALAVAVATMLEQGQTPPIPLAEGLRTAQINIRVNPEEKLRLKEAARHYGFKGISDYVRAAALESTKGILNRTA